MKLNNGQISVASQALSKLMGQKLPVLVSARLIRLAQELDIHLAVINAVRNNLFKQYGTEVDGQLIIKQNTPEMETFSKDWADLLSQEIDVKFEGEKIKLPWTIEIEPSSLLALEPFIVIPES
jgi:hypothetical protein